MPKKIKHRSVYRFAQPSQPMLIRSLVGAAMFAGVANILGLVGPLFMLEVYDRVLPSRSTPTLVALVSLVISTYLFSGAIDVVRTRLMIRLASAFDTSLSSRVFSAVMGVPLKTKVSGDGQRPVQELDQIRVFLSGTGPVAFLDLPWVPVYLALCFWIHPYIGWMATVVIFLLVALTATTHVMTRRWLQNASLNMTQRNVVAQQAIESAESLAAMGMQSRVSVLWLQHHCAGITGHRRATGIAGLCASVSKTIRLTVQSGALAVGAYLVINGSLSGGMIVAASIIVARALAPAEQVIATWRSFTDAREAWRRLQDLLALFPTAPEKTQVPMPAKRVNVKSLFVAPPGSQNLVLQNLNFSLEAGSALGVVGASASGKSSLAKALVGSWGCARGQVSFDGVPLSLFPAGRQGQLIGYMAQHTELIGTTIAESIARLDPAATDDQVIAAARIAGVHELILQLPNGYQTLVGQDASKLSAGQQQRIALARALYGDPFLVVLDEPNSNLDRDGELALSEAILSVKRRGGIVVVVAHRTNILAVLDQVLILNGGLQVAFGPKDKVLKSANNGHVTAGSTSL
ncbi:type I secretion system permease/ATPase [Pseudomonas sp. W2-17]|uniref:type I secretion system permease/ATPase n=1 Tax=Pseudomonas sp. W2-17 TaxID=3058039 RepID=UPI0034E0BD45